MVPDTGVGRERSGPAGWVRGIVRRLFFGLHSGPPGRSHTTRGARNGVAGGERGRVGEGEVVWDVGNGRGEDFSSAIVTASGFLTHAGRGTSGRGNFGPG